MTSATNFEISHLKPSSEHIGRLKHRFRRPHPCFIPLKNKNKT
ncbi:hypothetical protein HMPREF9418_0281 [Neisseria macacae ATCC 33926]|uniref:Uncharacterized protein n=1 Tax=Neisseria macacae ATCC 33926 TaxID=997348 RepID=A0AA36XLP1_9NEIS|nr:hypothetical protein HMPREF9418_0281 [Neisseria macacae ATCC 33926]